MADERIPLKIEVYLDDAANETFVVSTDVPRDYDTWKARRAPTLDQAIADVVADLKAAKLARP